MLLDEISNGAISVKKTHKNNSDKKEKKIEPTTKVRNLNVSLTVCILLFKTSEVYGELIAISALCPVEQQLLP